MKLEILLDIFFQLLSKRKITAAYLSEKYALSPRTIYRYVNVLAKSLPLTIKRGRDGGIILSDCYKLPIGFMSETEYSATVEALSAAYAQTLDQRYLQAKRKLTAEVKPQYNIPHTLGEIGNVFVCDGFSQNRRLADKLRLLEESIRQRELIEITYLGEKKPRTLEPYALIRENGAWYLYAFCRKERTFKKFAVGEMLSTLKTEESFPIRTSSHSDVTNDVYHQECECVDIRLKIAPNAVDTLQKCLGVDCIHTVDGVYFAELTLPKCKSLPSDILSLGADVEVIFPPSLREEVAILAKETAKRYL